MNAIQNKPNSSPKLELCSTLSEVEGPIKANSPAPERDTTDLASSGYQVYNDM
jgi:hypothetical protein